MTKMTKEDWKYLFSTQPTEYPNSSGGFKTNLKEKQFLSNVLHNVVLMLPRPLDNEATNAWNDMNEYINANSIKKKNLTSQIDKICEALDGKYEASEFLAHIVNKMQQVNEKMYSSSHIASFIGYLHIKNPHVEDAFNEIMSKDRKNLIYENLAWVDINNSKKQQKKDKSIELPSWIKENKHFFLVLEELGIAKSKKFLKFLSNVKDDDVQTFFEYNKDTLDKNMIFQEYLKSDTALQEKYLKNRETKSTLSDASLSFLRNITIQETARTPLVKLFENFPPEMSVKNREKFTQIFISYSQKEIAHVSFIEEKSYINIHIFYSFKTTQEANANQDKITKSMDEITTVFNDFKNIVATSPKIDKWTSNNSIVNDELNKEIKLYIQTAKEDKKITEAITNAIKTDDEPIKNNSFKL